MLVHHKIEITSDVNIPEPWLLVIVSFLLGLIPTYYAYQRGKREPIGCYSVRSVNVINAEKSSSIGNKLAVRYDSEPLTRLSVGIVTFWNGGTFTLDGNALVHRDPLRISVDPNRKILEATIIANPSPQCGCIINYGAEIAPNNVMISFDYLDNQNGITVRILHTADDDTLDVLGTLKGVRLEHEWGSTRIYNRIAAVFNYIYYGALAVVTIAFISVVLFQTLFGLPDSVMAWLSESSKWIIGFSFMGLLGGALIEYFKWNATHKIPPQLKVP